MAGNRIIDRLLNALRAVFRPVLQEWPLWLTTVVTLIPMTWAAWEYHILWLHDLPLSHLLGALVTDASVAAVVATVVVWLVSLIPGRRVVKWLVYTLLLALWLASLFLLRNFNTTYTPQVLQLLLETNRGESSEFLHAWIGAPGTRHAILMVLFTLALVLVAEWLRPRVARWLQRRVPMAVTSLLLTALLLLGLWNMRPLVRSYDSLYAFEMARSDNHANDIVSTLHASIVTLRIQEKETAAAIDLTINEAATGQATCAVDSMDLVLVIGESYNKWHSSLYGYSLDTSPLMRAERDRGLLTVFTDAISPYNLTSVTLKNLFSLNSLGHDERWNDFPMWTAVMRRAGWQIDVWDNQRQFMISELFTASLNMYLFHPDIVEQVYHQVNKVGAEFDGDLVKDYYADCSPACRNLVIFHLMGQHTQFSSRYPHTPEWEVWTPADVPGADAPYIDDYRRGVMLDYARATRYNDYVLAGIIEHYRDRNAVVVMLSDHGEEVYDYRDFIERDHNPDKTPDMVRHENEIPLLVWCSPVYKARHPERAAAIASAADRPVMNDAIGQMMLWLGEVNSPWCDSTRNVLHPAYKRAPRLIYDTIDYDSLMAR